MTFKDQLQRSLFFKTTPTRIISLVPSQTELLVTLGLEDHIVGITKFCLHPKNLKSEKTIIGGTKQVHYDRIVALEPDVILCNKEENTEEMVAKLEAIATVHISDVYKIEHGLELIDMYGELFNKGEQSAVLIDGILNEQKKLQKVIRLKNQLSVIYVIWKDPWMVVANDTYINSMLTACGFKNYFENQTRYPEVDLDDLMTEEVDVILLSSEPYPFKMSHVDYLQTKFPKSQIKLVDGEMFSWFGSRMLLAFKYFRSLREDL